MVFLGFSWFSWVYVLWALLVWWSRGSGWPVGLVGPLVWWACGSVGGPVGQVDLFVFIAKSPTLRGPTCQGVLGLVLNEVRVFLLNILFCISSSTCTLDIISIL